MTDPASRTGERVVVVGATSGIGRALCHRLASRAGRLVVAGRDLEELERIASDLTIRHEIPVAAERFDALDFASHSAFVVRCLVHLDDRIDGVVVCHGYLPEPRTSEREPEVARRTIDVNFTSVASVLTPVAERMVEQGGGWIAAISSVAGDRGRQGNYLYGSAKAGLTTYLQGLRNRLFRHGVHVVTIKPGFVDTAMLRSAGVSDGPLVASPERVAKDIDRAIRRRSDVSYTPWFWRPIMLAIRSIPERLFKRMKL